MMIQVSILARFYHTTAVVREDTNQGVRTRTKAGFIPLNYKRLIIRLQMF
jgi:hypothetical protein